MKLVNINRQSVQSLGRHSIGNTGFEGDIAKSKAIADTMSDLAFQASDMINQRQQQKADLNQSKGESEFWKQWGGRDFYDVAELPSDVVTEGMQIEGTVSSATVLPQLYASHMKEVMEQSSSMIEMPGSKQAWTGRQSQIYNEKLVSVQMEANSLYEKQTQQEQLRDYEDAMDAGRPDVALGLADTMWATEDVKAGFKKSARIESEILAYEDIKSFDYINGSRDERAENDAQLAEAIAHLSQTQKGYVGNDGNFDSTLKNGWQDELIRIREARKSLLKSNDKRAKQDLQYRISSLRDAATKELGIDSSEAQSVHRDLVAWNADNDNELHKLQKEFEDDLASYGIARKHITLSPSDRRRKIETGYNVFKDSASRNDRANDIIKGIDESFNKGLIDNPMKTLQDSGFFEQAYGSTGLAPIDLRASQEQLSDQLRNRLTQYELAAAANEAIGGGPLESSQEAPRISALINSLNAREQQHYITAIQNGMGDKSGLLYGQLALDGSSKTFSIAGDATNGENLIGSENMLLGMEYYKQNSEDYDDVREAIDIATDKALMNAYSTKPKKRAAVREAILHGYVGYTKDMEKKTSFDSDLIDRAVRDATGGLFEYNGNMFPNPEYGMADDDMGNWIRNTSVKHIERVGAPVGQSAQEFVNDLRTNNYKLTATRKSDEFIVSTEAGTPLIAVDGSAYVLKYDSFAERRPDPQYLMDYVMRYFNEDEE